MQPYLLGDADPELRRLIDQARLFGDLTEQMFHHAGLGAGMRVLDVGCGAGDVSFLAARFVGPTGRVLGIDRSPQAVEFATARAATAGLAHVSFEVADLTQIRASEPFDAVVGRLVLVYQTDPVAVLRHLAQQVRAGGLLAFQEMEMSAARSIPALPLMTRCLDSIRQSFRAAGLDVDLGLRLHELFRAAGLPARMLLGARLETDDDSQAWDMVGQLVRTLLPMMRRHGVKSPEELDSLPQRLCQEIVGAHAVFRSPSMIGAWARV